MARKGENIYKRKDGRYEGRYIKDYDMQGKSIIGYVYGKTYKDAKEKLLVAKAQVKQRQEHRRLGGQKHVQKQRRRRIFCGRRCRRTARRRSGAHARQQDLGKIAQCGKRAAACGDARGHVGNTQRGDRYRAGHLRDFPAGSAHRDRRAQRRQEHDRQQKRRIACR